MGARRRLALDRHGSIADVVVVWAHSQKDGQVKGFLVERETPGFRGASRAIWQADISLEGHAVADAATACFSKSGDFAIWATSRSFTPTKAPKPCKP